MNPPNQPHVVAPHRSTLRKSLPATPKEDRSVNVPQRIEKILAGLNASASTYRRWLVEFTSLAISALCMAGIIGILVSIQNRAPPKWSIGDPETIITVLAKIAAAALIIPTSEAIGQLKWNWFHGNSSREIYDFEIFDKASRGPWGSFMLLMITQGKSLAALGALLTLLMLAIDSTFQQLMIQPQRWEEFGVAQIPRVTYYQAMSRRYLQQGFQQLDVDEDMSTIVHKFLFDNGTQHTGTGYSTGTTSETLCPTSNCTWPIYETLGICSACTDVTQLLQYACLNSTLDWPSNVTDTSQTWPGESTMSSGTMCGYFINATSESPVLMSGYSIDQASKEALLMRTIPLVTMPGTYDYFGGRSLNFQSITYPLMDFIISSTPGGYDGVYRNETPLVQECLLYWCVKSLKAVFFEGKYTEVTVSTFTNTTSIEEHWSVSNFTDPTTQWIETQYAYLNNITINTESESGGSSFGLSNDSHIRVIGTLDTFTPAFTTAQNTTAPPLMRHDLIRSAPTLRNIPVNPWLEPHNIPQHMERMASAMSNVMLTTSSSSEVNGTAWVEESFVEVRWAWISYPLVLLVLSVVFLFATIRTSSKAVDELGVWKTSAMPTLLYGLPRTTQDAVKLESPTWTKMLREDRTKRIKLLPNKGWRVSGCSSAPSTPVVAQCRGLHGQI